MNLSSLLRIALVSFGFCVATSGYAQQQLSSCSFKIHVRQDCLWTDWSYQQRLIESSIEAPSGSMMSSEEVETALDRKLEELVLSEYEDVFYNRLRLRREIVAPTRVGNGTGRDSKWFFHYERRPWGSAAQCLEIAHTYTIRSNSVVCIHAP